MFFKAYICHFIYFCFELVYLIRVFTQFYINSKYIYTGFIKQVLEYISTTLDWSLAFEKKVNILNYIIRYINFDFEVLKLAKKSLKIFNFIFIEIAISYFSKFQSIIILFAHEIRYITMYKIRKKNSLVKLFIKQARI